MKHVFTKLTLFCFSTLFINISINAQSTKGLERVIVEKYYVSNQADADASEGTLPVGSVTWRIYVDMLPGYNFKIAKGNSAHPLAISTTTTFFNNEDRGSTTPGFSKANAKKNTVMLDSWLSAGAACSGNFGVLKTDDDGVATVVNADGALQNADASAGVPLKDQDGLLAVADKTPGECGFIGLDDVISVFDDASQTGNSLTTTTGGWYCLEGAIGPDATTNKVLIAQLTTDGILSFKLNVQIGTPEGNSEYYVPENPGYAPVVPGEEPVLEILDPTLNFNSIIDEIVTVGLSKEKIYVFPNPTNDVLNIALPSDFTEAIYTVYNMLGTKVDSKNINNKLDTYNHVDMGSFPNGIYFVEVLSKGVKSTFKVIKKN